MPKPGGGSFEELAEFARLREAALTQRQRRRIELSNLAQQLRTILDAAVAELNAEIETAGLSPYARLSVIDPGTRLGILLNLSPAALRRGVIARSFVVYRIELPGLPERAMALTFDLADYGRRVQMLPLVPDMHAPLAAPDGLPSEFEEYYYGDSRRRDQLNRAVRRGHDASGDELRRDIMAVLRSHIAQFNTYAMQPQEVAAPAEPQLPAEVDLFVEELPVAEGDEL